jgi:hypothetical protein
MWFGYVMKYIEYRRCECNFKFLVVQLVIPISVIFFQFSC